MKGIHYFTFGLLLFLAGGFFFSFIFKFNQATQNLKPETVQNIVDQQYCDSIKNELFIQETTVHRYELSLDHLREVNPKAADVFDDFLSHRTE